MPPPNSIDLALFAIFLVVLVFPFKVHFVERNLELFLFAMGATAVTVAGKWTWGLVQIAVEEPITKGIVPAVLIAGLAFFFGRVVFEKGVNAVLKLVPLDVVIVVTVVALGLLASVITAIIAALLLVEVANRLPLEPKQKTSLVIIACFSIGLGAALTPLGEPLSTIAVVKLSGPPYHAGFWYLFDQLGILIGLGILACGMFGAFYLGSRRRRDAQRFDIVVAGGSLREVFVRTVRVYAFVAALFLLGAGMELIVDKYFTHLPAMALFWLNMVSAILDNATLTAAEIAPSMSQAQITAALMGLLVSGGMLIPGNIPNIIAASKLGITSSEWARLGLPLGLTLNAIYFVLVFVFGFSPSLSMR